MLRSILTILFTVLAVVLIVLGIWVFLRAFAGIWPPINPPGGPTKADEPAVDPPQLFLLGLEIGGMALGTGDVVRPQGGVIDVTVEPPPIDPVTPDPCAPQVESGFAADANVNAIGMVRLYSEPDVESQTRGEYNAGQSFTVTADMDGVTAVRRCEVVWVRVRLAPDLFGWVLGSAIELGPVIVPTLPPICPGGCGTPTCVPPCPDPCVQPCPDPCYSPCSGQNSQQWNSHPCTPPCGVYTQ